MHTNPCEAVRDLLPDVLSGGIGTADALRVETHLATCPDCAAEHELLRAVRQSVPSPPVGLEGRIMRAVAAPGPTVGRANRSRSFAIAAVAASVVITGGLLVRSQQSEADAGRNEVAVSVTPGWPAVQDPVLRVTPVLDDLSVEELETLLAELES